MASAGRKLASTGGCGCSPRRSGSRPRRGSVFRILPCISTPARRAGANNLPTEAMRCCSAAVASSSSNNIGPGLTSTSRIRMLEHLGDQQRRRDRRSRSRWYGRGPAREGRNCGAGHQIAGMAQGDTAELFLQLGRNPSPALSDASRPMDQPPVVRRLVGRRCAAGVQLLVTNRTSASAAEDAGFSANSAIHPRASDQIGLGR